MTREQAVNRVRSAGLVATTTTTPGTPNLAGVTAPATGAAASGSVDTSSAMTEAHDTGDSEGVPLLHHDDDLPGGPTGPAVVFIVSRQTPAGGTTVNRGSTVRLTVERLDL
jgi:hypothetical protein